MQADAPLPRILAYPASEPPVLVAQGAEAQLFRTTFLTPDRPCALKFRPPKTYRHPVLDARLTRQRILAEARILHKCRRDGVPVPALYAVDIDDGLGPVTATGNATPTGSNATPKHRGGSLLTEWIDGGPVRARLNDWLAEQPKSESESKPESASEPPLEASPELLGLMQRIGATVAGLHRVGVVHGDLTTSNLMLRPSRQTDSPPSSSAQQPDQPTTLDGDIVVIDFGLASQSTSDEDRAVDLYVLERAFGSTHPRAEPVFGHVLAAYRAAFKQAAPVLRKLEDVRMRGRKRSMLG